jgi:hypothetical protein
MYALKTEIVPILTANFYRLPRFLPTKDSGNAMAISAACHALGTGSMNVGYTLSSVLYVQLFKSGEPIITYLFSVLLLSEVGLLLLCC